MKRNNLAIAVCYGIWVILFSLLFRENSMVNSTAYFIAHSLLFFVTAFLIKRFFIGSSNKKFLVIATATTIATVIIAIAPILSYAWTCNHEGLAWKDRTLIYVYHLCNLDLFPVWSTSHANDFGAPSLLYYHKLFYYVSALFYMITQEMKFSILLSSAVFFIAGVAGVFKISRFLGVSKFTSLAISLSLIFLNYTVTNWFVRGAFSEFSAMMLIPWLILWELKFIKYKQWGYSIIPLLILLYMAHSIIVYYGIFSALFAVIIGSLKKISAKEFRRLFIRAAISVLIVALAIGIYAVPMFLLSDHYDPSRIKSCHYTPQYRLIAAQEYIFDSKYKWLYDCYSMSVQLDIPVLLFILLAAIIYGYSAIKKLNVQPGIKSFRQIEIIFFLIFSNLFFMFLQLPASLIFYNNVPGADFIQFPWRLLSFIQALNLVILIYIISLIEKTKIKRAGLFLSAGLLLTLLISYPLFRHNDYTWVGKKDVESKKIGQMNGVGEYFPNLKNLTGDEIADFYWKVRNYESLEDYARHNCSILLSAPPKPEQMWVEYNVDCKMMTTVKLPYNYSGYEKLYKIERANKEKVALQKFRTDADPRIQTNLPAGDYILRLEFPTLLDFYFRGSN